MTYRILQRSRLIILILSFIHFFLSIILLFLPAFSHPVFLTDDLLRTFLCAFSTVRTFLRINTDADVRAAARLANADSFIRRLPDGYDTMLESDGANLSQGQRQLIAIARAAIARPPVLILDEATSSVDTRTERLIERGMDALMEGRTVLVIAHRLSTVRNAQAIFVLEKGVIVERGDHDDLLSQKGRYYKLYTGQYILE